MTGLQKHVIFMVAVLLAVCLCSTALGESANNWLLRLGGAADPLTADDVPDDLVKLTTRRNDNKGVNTNGGVYLASSTSIRLVEEAAEALTAMMNAAEEAGCVVYVRQGYRSYEDEARAYERVTARGEDAPKPGESDYQTGLAVTLVTKDYRAKALDKAIASTSELTWLADNCGQFGFILRYPEGKEAVTGCDYEPWHFRYVGEAAATITENGWTLEEYLTGHASDPAELPAAADAASVKPLATPAPAKTAPAAPLPPHEEGTISTWLLRLASADDPMGENEEPAGLVTLTSRRNDNDGKNSNGGLYLANSTHIQLVEEAAAALTEMLEDAEDVGHVIYVRQGYRSYADEARAYDRVISRGGEAPKPGETDYQTGLAVTLVTKDYRAKALDKAIGDTDELRWLASNCSRYGFILRYPEGKQAETGCDWEPWHFRYVGEDAAKIIRLNHLSLEEFCASVDLDGVSDGAAPASIDLDELPFETPIPLPEGPIILDETDEDGDHEIILFHD